MPDYQNGKIYKIWSPEGDEIYIGSTTKPLYKRLNHHKTKQNCSSKILFEKYTDVRIELVECYPCNNKEELNKKEGEFIRTLNCVNRCIAGRTTKEYYEENKEFYKDYSKEWRVNNKEHIQEYYKEWSEKNKEHRIEYDKEYRSQPYTCECGRTIRFGYKGKHFKTKIHKELMQEVAEP